MRHFIIGLTAAALLGLAAVSSTLAGGPPGPAFYVDGELFRTVGTPNDLSGTGAPADSYDVIYDLGGNGILNVAESQPGETDYNGGRWLVFAVTWLVEPYQLTSAEDVLAAEADGDLIIGSDPVKQFVCPVIPVAGG